MQPENATPKNLAQENAEKYATEKCNKILNSSISHFCCIFFALFCCCFHFFCIFLFPRVLVVLFELLKTEGHRKKLKNTIPVFAFVCTFFAFVCLHVFCMFLEFLQFFDYFKTGGLSKKAKNARFQNLHAFCIFPESARFFACLFAFFCTCILWLIFFCIF